RRRVLLIAEQTSGGRARRCLERPCTRDRVSRSADGARCGRGGDSVSEEQRSAPRLGRLRSRVAEVSGRRRVRPLAALPRGVDLSDSPVLASQFIPTREDGEGSTVAHRIPWFGPASLLHRSSLAALGINFGRGIGGGSISAI